MKLKSFAKTENDAASLVFLALICERSIDREKFWEMEKKSKKENLKIIKGRKTSFFHQTVTYVK